MATKKQPAKKTIAKKQPAKKVNKLAAAVKKGEPRTRTGATLKRGKKIIRTTVDLTVDQHKAMRRFMVEQQSAGCTQAALMRALITLVTTDATVAKRTSELLARWEAEGNPAGD